MNLADYNRILKDIALVSETLWRRGWAEKNAGNLSVDVTEFYFLKRHKKSSIYFRFEKRFEYLKNGLFLITPSGSRFRDIAIDITNQLMLLKIDESGSGYYILSNFYNKKPTSELKTHLEIHNYLRIQKSEMRVVLHTHPTELVALSHIKEYQSTNKFSDILISAHPEVYINLANRIGFVRYFLTGSQRLADETLNLIKAGRTLIIWERHGALSIDRDVMGAFDHLDIANKAADITLRLMMVGKKPQKLTDYEMRELKGLSS